MEGHQRKASFFNRSYHGRSVSSRSNTGYVMMHDVNIEEETMYETSILALLLFSSLSMNIRRLLRLRIEKNVGFKSNISPQQLIMLRGIAWLAQLKQSLVKAYQIY